MALEIQIRLTFWFDAGSRIIEFNLRGVSIPISRPCVDLSPYPNHFPNPAGQC